ncbi:MAG TPA: hypothetical protein PKV16_01030 [Caldisericia bacterium]|nr:hypothetical protein [Caldisericia bacterium]HPF49004.1 hypothetical protein [Caldisericia bacterium]HPI83132.1 hypothetical protein [Caldisericia bacterium]HPQ92359.1 hypothetical protein [Caldisericia bacterium]HRV74543.1 hypothetical protein [Caldisericia bacterium]
MKKYISFILGILLAIGIQVKGQSYRPTPLLDIETVEAEKFHPPKDFGHRTPVLVGESEFENFLIEEVFSYDEVEKHLWVQTINNGDLVIYFRQPEHSPSRVLRIRIAIPGIKQTGTLWSHSYNSRSSYAADPIHANYESSLFEKVAKLRSGVSVLEFGEGSRSLFISRPGKFINKPVSLLQRVDEPSETHIIANDKELIITIDFKETGDEFEEGLIIASSDRLVAMGYERSMDPLYVSDFNRIKFLRLNGWWYTTRPGDYEGSEIDCYYKNPGFYPSSKHLKWYCDTYNRLFYDIVMSTMKTAIVESPESGIVRMEVVPLMFKRWYGLEKNYIDTRFATDGARFLANCASAYGSKQAYEKSILLAKLYQDMSISIGTKIGDGVFLPDYIQDKDSEKPIHTSLNHALCEVNYLLEIAKLHDDKLSLNLANAILLAIDETCDSWIRPNGDLWYAYFPETGEFKLDDYEDLTYNDLVETQQLHREMLGCSRLSIQKLINTKNEYRESIKKDREEDASNGEKGSY